MCQPVKLVGENYSQVLVLLDEDNGLSLDFRVEARTDVSASWPMGSSAVFECQIVRKGQSLNVHNFAKTKDFS